MIASLLRRNNAATSFRRNNDVIGGHAYLYQTHCKLVVKGCWFRLGDAYLHVMNYSMQF